MSNTPLNFAGSIPQHYDDYLGPFLFEPYAVDLLERTDLSAVKNILEMACGTGRVTKHLAENLPEGTQLTATDLKQDMITVAQQRISSPRVKWETADMTDLPYQDDLFDLVVSQYGIMLVPDQLKALTEAYRVLQKDGKLVFTVWGNVNDNPVWDICARVVNSFFEDHPLDLYAGPFSMHDQQATLDLLTKAGFTTAKVESVTKTGHTDSAATAAKGFIQGLPIFMIIKQKNPALLPKIEEALEKEFIHQLGDQPFQSPLHAWLFEAHK